MFKRQSSGFGDGVGVAVTAVSISEQVCALDAVVLEGRHRARLGGGGGDDGVDEADVVAGFWVPGSTAASMLAGELDCTTTTRSRSGITSMSCPAKPRAAYAGCPWAVVIQIWYP